MLYETWPLSGFILVFNGVWPRLWFKPDYIVICGAKIVNDIYRKGLENEPFFKSDVLSVRLLWLGIRLKYPKQSRLKQIDPTSLLKVDIEQSQELSDSDFEALFTKK
jgi:hypothetical protein